jgi:hypothetical protein
MADNSGLGFNLDSFRSNFHTGARAYLFYIKPMLPSSVTNRLGSQSKISYLVRSSMLPDNTLEEIPASWQGYDYKVAGKYTFMDWTVTFNVDLAANLYKMFIDWQRLIHDPSSNVHRTPNEYFADQELQLLGLSGSPIMQYKLYGAWPKTVGQISLDYAQNDYAMFDVTFSYQYHLCDSISYESQPTFGSQVTLG